MQEDVEYLYCSLDDVIARYDQPYVEKIYDWPDGGIPGIEWFTFLKSGRDWFTMGATMGDILRFQEARLFGRVISDFAEVVATDCDKVEIRARSLDDLKFLRHPNPIKPEPKKGYEEPRTSGKEDLGKFARYPALNLDVDQIVRRYKQPYVESLYAWEEGQLPVINWYRMLEQQSDWFDMELRHGDILRMQEKTSELSIGVVSDFVLVSETDYKSYYLQAVPPEEVKKRIGRPADQMTH